MLIRPLLEDHFLTGFPSEKLLKKQKKAKSSLPENRKYMKPSLAKAFRKDRYRQLKASHVIKMDYETTRVVQHFLVKALPMTTEKAEFFSLCKVPDTFPTFVEMDVIFSPRARESFTIGVLLMDGSDSVHADHYRPTSGTLLDPVCTIELTSDQIHSHPNAHMEPFLDFSGSLADVSHDDVQAEETEVATNMTMTAATYFALIRLAPDLFETSIGKVFSRLDRLRMKRLTGEDLGNMTCTWVTLGPAGKTIAGLLSEAAKNGVEDPDLPMELQVVNGELRWIPETEDAL